MTHAASKRYFFLRRKSVLWRFRRPGCRAESGRVRLLHPDGRHELSRLRMNPIPVPSAGGLVARRKVSRPFITSNIFYFHNNDATIRIVSHLVQDHGSPANNHVSGGVWIVVSQVFPPGGFRKDADAGV